MTFEEDREVLNNIKLAYPKIINKFHELLNKHLQEIEFIEIEFAQIKNGKIAMVTCRDREIFSTTKMGLIPDAYGPIVTEGNTILKVVKEIKKSKPDGAIKAFFWNNIECYPAFEFGRKRYVFSSPQIYWLFEEKEGKKRYQKWYEETGQYKKYI